MFQKEIASKTLAKAWGHLTKAIGLRERIYRGAEEAVQRWHEREAQGLHQTEATPEDARYKFMNSQTGEALLADQNWQMRQADAHSGIANALLLEGLLEAQKETNALLQGISRSLNQ